MSTCSRCGHPVSQFVTDPEDGRRVCPCVVSWHEMWRDEKQVSKWYKKWLAEMRRSVMQGSLLEV